MPLIKNENIDIFSNSLETFCSVPSNNFFYIKYIFFKSLNYLIKLLNILFN